MAICKIVSVLVLAFMLQVSALPSENGAQKHDITAHVAANEPFTTLKELYTSTKTSLNKLQSCGTGTHLEVFALASTKLGDFQACVNATREIADYEDFLFHLYNFAKFTGTTFIDLVEDVIGCRHQSGFFTILNCTVTEVQSSGPAFDEVFSKAEELITEVKYDTDSLVYYLKKCFGRSTSEFLSELRSIINKC